MDTTGGNVSIGTILSFEWGSLSKNNDYCHWIRHSVEPTNPDDPTENAIEYMELLSEGNEILRAHVKTQGKRNSLTEISDARALFSDHFQPSQMFVLFESPKYAAQTPLPSFGLLGFDSSKYVGSKFNWIHTGDHWIGKSHSGETQFRFNDVEKYLELVEFKQGESINRTTLQKISDSEFSSSRMVRFFDPSTNRNVQVDSNISITKVSKDAPAKPTLKIAISNGKKLQLMRA